MPAMKLRCPHCQTVFEKLEKPACPTCGRTLRMAWERDMKTPAARLVWRQTHKRRQEMPPRRQVSTPKPGMMMLPLFLLTYRSRFFLWTLVLVTVIAGRILFTRVKEVPIMPDAESWQVQRARAELRALRTGLEWFRAHCKRYPTDAEGLRALVRDPEPGVPGWDGNYIDQLTPDPWGRAYRYACTNDTVALGSCGPDGRPGTADDVAAPEPDWKALLQRVDVKELPKWGTNAVPPAAAPLSRP
jgi:general secretion pathway protein G